MEVLQMKKSKLAITMLLAIILSIVSVVPVFACGFERTIPFNMTLTEWQQHQVTIARTWDPPNPFHHGLLVAVSGRTYVHSGWFNIVRYPVVSFGQWTPTQSNGLRTRSGSGFGDARGWVSSSACPIRSAAAFVDDVDMMCTSDIDFYVLPLDDDAEILPVMDIDMFLLVLE